MHFFGEECIVAILNNSVGCNGTQDVECIQGGTLKCLRNVRCNSLKQCDGGEDEEGCTESKWRTGS